MSQESTACPECGKSAVSGGAFCAFCGAGLPKDATADARRSIPVPDRDGLSGPCVIVYAGREQMDVRRVGRIVADAVERPLPDVTRQMRTSKGFVATAVDAQVAVPLAERIEKELKEQILVIPEDACVPLPPVMRIRGAGMTAEGVECEAYTWDRTERLHAGWDEIFLVSCARLRVEEVVEKPEENPGRKSFVAPRVPNLVTQVHHEFLVDVILFDFQVVDPPHGIGHGRVVRTKLQADSEEHGTSSQAGWRRLRLDHNTAGFSLTQLAQDPTQALGLLYRSSLSLQRYARGVPMNRGVELLASGASDTAWESLTFLSKRDFDLYTYWLMQLVRYGSSIRA